MANIKLIVVNNFSYPFSGSNYLSINSNGVINVNAAEDTNTEYVGNYLVSLSYLTDYVNTAISHIPGGGGEGGGGGSSSLSGSDSITISPLQKIMVNKQWVISTVLQDGDWNNISVSNQSKLSSMISNWGFRTAETDDNWKYGVKENGGLGLTGTTDTTRQFYIDTEWLDTQLTTNVSGLVKNYLLSVDTPHTAGEVLKINANNDGFEWGTAGISEVNLSDVSSDATANSVIVVGSNGKLSASSETYLKSGDLYSSTKKLSVNNLSSATKPGYIKVDSNGNTTIVNLTYLTADNNLNVSKLTGSTAGFVTINGSNGVTIDTNTYLKATQAEVYNIVKNIISKGTSHNKFTITNKDDTNQIVIADLGDGSGAGTTNYVYTWYSDSASISGNQDETAPTMGVKTDWLSGQIATNLSTNIAVPPTLSNGDSKVLKIKKANNVVSYLWGEAGITSVNLSDVDAGTGNSSKLITVGTGTTLTTSTGNGFVKVANGVVSYDNSIYLTTAGLTQTNIYEAVAAIIQKGTSHSGFDITKNPTAKTITITDAGDGSGGGGKTEDGVTTSGTTTTIGVKTDWLTGRISNYLSTTVSTAGMSAGDSKVLKAEKDANGIVTYSWQDDLLAGGESFDGNNTISPATGDESITFTPATRTTKYTDQTIQVNTTWLTNWLNDNGYADTNDHMSTYMYVNTDWNGTGTPSNSASDQADPYIFLVEKYSSTNTKTNSIQIKAGTDISVKAKNGVITIGFTNSSGYKTTDNDTRYKNATNDTSLIFGVNGTQTVNALNAIKVNTEWLDTYLNGKNYITNDNDHAYKYSNSDQSITFDNNDGYDYSASQTANNIHINPAWLSGHGTTTAQASGGYIAIYNALTSVLNTAPIATNKYGLSSSTLKLNPLKNSSDAITGFTYGVNPQGLGDVITTDSNLNGVYDTSTQKFKISIKDTLSTAIAGWGFVRVTPGGTLALTDPVYSADKNNLLYIVSDSYNTLSTIMHEGTGVSLAWNKNGANDANGHVTISVDTDTLVASVPNYYGDGGNGGTDSYIQRTAEGTKDFKFSIKPAANNVTRFLKSVNGSILWGTDNNTEYSADDRLIQLTGTNSNVFTIKPGANNQILSTTLVNSTLSTGWVNTPAWKTTDNDTKYKNETGDTSLIFGVNGTQTVNALNAIKVNTEWLDTQIGNYITTNNIPTNDTNTRYKLVSVVSQDASTASKIPTIKLQSSTDGSTYSDQNTYKISGQNNVKVTSDSNGNIIIDGTHTHTFDHYNSYLYVGAKDGTANGTTNTTTDTYLLHVENGVTNSQVKLAGTNINISSNGGTLTLSGAAPYVVGSDNTKYQIATNGKSKANGEAQIMLSGSDTTSTYVNISGDGTYVKVTTDTNGNLLISGAPSGTVTHPSYTLDASNGDTINDMKLTLRKNGTSVSNIEINTKNIKVGTYNTDDEQVIDLSAYQYDFTIASSFAQRHNSLSTMVLKPVENPLIALWKDTLNPDSSSDGWGMAAQPIQFRGDGKYTKVIGTYSNNYEYPFEFQIIPSSILYTSFSGFIADDGANSLSSINRRGSKGIPAVKTNTNTDPNYVVNFNNNFGDTTCPQFYLSTYTLNNKHELFIHPVWFGLNLNEHLYTGSRADNLDSPFIHKLHRVSALVQGTPRVYDYYYDFSINSSWIIDSCIETSPVSTWIVNNCVETQEVSTWFGTLPGRVGTYTGTTTIALNYNTGDFLTGAQITSKKNIQLTVSNIPIGKGILARFNFSDGGVGSKLRFGAANDDSSNILEVPEAGTYYIGFIRYNKSTSILCIGVRKILGAKALS